MEKCHGDLILLSGDGESGEGMSEPFFCICQKCGETDFYAVNATNKGCHMFTSDESSRLNTFIFDTETDSLMASGEVLLKASDLCYNKDILRTVVALYEKFGLIAITDHIIEDRLEEMEIPYDDMELIKSALNYFIYE